MAWTLDPDDFISREDECLDCHREIPAGQALCGVCEDYREDGITEPREEC